MNAAVATAIAFAVYVVGYMVYSRYLASTVFELRPDVDTPAHTRHDGVEYVPSRAPVLFGHHYASIAGLAPMLGPAVAVIWGWFPAMAWVVLGALFIGCVHDFGSLVLSVRARGMSIGKVAEGIIGRRAKTLFHIIIFFLIALAMGVFVAVLGQLLSPESPIGFPRAVFPTFGLMVVAVIIGVLGYKKGISWKILTPIGFAIVMILMYASSLDPVVDTLLIADPEVAPSVEGWKTILLVYALLACVLPVWTLLQPRDFLNSLLLYVGLGAVYLGLFVLQPEFDAPAIRTDPEGAPSMIPFVFIIVACGAASGFHSLVASGTTAKQLNRETDARVIGYGGMIGESLLGLIAVLATTAGMLSASEWDEAYSDWGSIEGQLGAQIDHFVNGCATFLEALGIDPHLGATFIALIVVSYALTSLDSATRLLRYNVEEIAETVSRVTGLEYSVHRYASSIVAVSAIGFFAFYEIDGTPAGLTLWALFGTTNQLLAALALLAITLYLLMRDKPWYVTGVPMIAMLGTTLTAMITNTREFYGESNWLLAVIGTILLVLAVWLVVESAWAIYRHLRSGRTIDDLAVFPGDESDDNPPS